MEKGDTGTLESIDEFGFDRIGKSGFSNQDKCVVTSFSTSFDDELSDVASTSDEQNLTFSGH